MRAIVAGVAGPMVLMVSGCSYQAALDKMVSPERQKEIVDIGQRFCTDPVANTRLLHPEIAGTAAEAAPLLPRECPAGRATWQLASYQWKTNVEPGLKQQQEEAVVIGTGKGKWTTVSLRFFAENGGPTQITSWNVLGSATKPDALRFAEQYETGVKVIAAVGAAVLLAIGGLVFWLVRRSRARKAATPPLA
ncbi:hypothetical protein EAO27_11535 [Sphingopyxis sp. YF1]|uniref:hypothetical protein n=1 Tax=Sphingopyxis sp. YF1 TaxID=2482763 RepID=UPI001F620256|nr:hypothetical protein [Sphingopyxis sp. YF1]UNU43272.1 hypothetical protein EAO27_11535 [Sphingopyxis sp. YF1]